MAYSTEDEVCRRHYAKVESPRDVVTGCNPNDLDIWTDWCRLGLQFVTYKSTEQEWSFVNEFLYSVFNNYRHL